jgi:hypothetical protein
MCLQYSTTVLRRLLSIVLSETLFQGTSNYAECETRQGHPDFVANYYIQRHFLSTPEVE